MMHTTHVQQCQLCLGSESRGENHHAVVVDFVSCRSILCRKLSRSATASCKRGQRTGDGQSLQPRERRQNLCKDLDPFPFDEVVCITRVLQNSTLRELT